MESLVAAVKPLVATDASTDASGSSSSTAFAFPSSDSAQDAVFPREQLVRLVSAANKTYASTFGAELSALLPRSDKLLLLAFASSSLLRGVWSAADQAEWIGLLKILARTQSDLDEYIFTKEFVLLLVGNIVEFASGTGATETAVRSQSIRLLLNLCIINRDRVHQAFGCESQKSVSLFGKSSESSSADTGREYPSLVPLVRAFTQVVDTQQEPDALFFCARIMLLVMVRIPLARASIEHANLYESLIASFLHHSSGKQLGVQLRDDTSDAAAAADAPVATSSFVASPASNLKVSAEILKVLANLSLDESLPTAHDKLAAAGKDALYRAHIARITALLAHGVEIPEEVLVGYKGDPVANAAIGTMMPPPTLPTNTTSVDATEEATVALEEVTLNSTPEVSATSAPSQSATAAAPSVASSSSPAPAAPASSASSSSAAASFVPVQRQQTRILLAQMSNETDGESALVQLQRDVSHLLIGSDGPKAIPMLESDGCTAFHGLMQLLHRSLILAGSNKRDGELLLLPIISALSPLVRDSETLRAHAKRCIFLDLATPPTEVNGAPYKKADANNYAMTPAGAISEKITDPDPLSLKSLVLTWVISLNFNVKQAVSELLYRICSEDTSEYIRLLGFGSAVGLLAEKGLPGFSMLGRKQHEDPEALVREKGKKL